jgi:hypothetical protein
MCGAVAALGMAGCDRHSLPPAGPTPGETRLEVTAIDPQKGVIGSDVRISGIGFSPGATVTLGGAASNVRFVSSTLITATTPVDAGGTVDVVVTNPNGRSAVLSGAYTYEAITLTVSASEVAPGGPLSVSWAAPSGRPSGDWIGLFKIGDPSTSYEDIWWRYTNGTTSGTLTLNAPMQPGPYEFRYLLDDGYVDAARIAVTVMAKD